MEGYFSYVRMKQPDLPDGQILVHVPEVPEADFVSFADETREETEEKIQAALEIAFTERYLAGLPIPYGCHTEAEAEESVDLSRIPFSCDLLPTRAYNLH